MSKLFYSYSYPLSRFIIQTFLASCMLSNMAEFVKNNLVFFKTSFLQGIFSGIPYCKNSNLFLLLFSEQQFALGYRFGNRDLEPALPAQTPCLLFFYTQARL